MSLSKLFKSRRLWAFSAALLTAAGFFVFGTRNNSAAGEQTSTAAGLNTMTMFAAVPESLNSVPSALKSKNCQSAVPTSMDVIFNVSEMKGAVKNIGINNLKFDPQFKWGAGLTAVLISPDGTVSKTLFGNPAAKNCSALENLTGDYNYTNETLNTAFSKISDANGAWILRLTDNAGNKLGTVKNVSLAISTDSSPNAAGAPIIPTNADFDGDGKTDYVVIRDASANLSNSLTAPTRTNAFARKVQRRERRKPSFTNPNAVADNSLVWYIGNNGTNALTSVNNGDAATDFPVPADFDGDGKNDVTVWRPISEDSAAFFILQSATNTLRVDYFGIGTDDYTVVADYDGDKKADPATFRCPDSPGQCYFYYRGSLNNPNNQTTYVPWGFGTDLDFYTYPGDFDGDGKADFCIVRANPSNPTQAQFVLLKSADFKFEFINWGLFNDFLIPGDYDGDKKTDFCVMRSESLPQDPNESFSYYILQRAGGGTGNSPLRFGYQDDAPVPGDYDGDGKTDLAIWRQSPDPVNDPTPDIPKFIIYRSSDKNVVFYPFGLPGDAPVAGWQYK